MRALYWILGLRELSAVKRYTTNVVAEWAYHTLRLLLGKPQDSDTTVRCVSEAFCGTIALAVLCECCGGGVEQESRMEMFGFFDVLVLASGTLWMLQVCSRMYPPTLQQPPHHKEQQ